ncbi:hypothetical protein with phosphopantetheine attachment site (plasmid) [Afipia carboxidovorans OM5]|uniref:Uncharacterized protein n=1 Tax=Afipia carboxidovorans (strain ATCC 49405 / DSM 1227 / KCTC 32145 / OM5) TaxID=504832 RepID=F8C0X8_AFIC5|nr:hypothetical protein [Afipia carboxidovorans]AEI04460.1 hypothetical protein with phosphopantetheine attachment site [Afipia carboxidovorans OM4]AEI08088.1 hypothetical protein with phosphopantetheine attachment site [Afipia carboxidovorans OM5]
MTESSDRLPTKLPDHNSVEAVLARLSAGADSTVLAEALTRAFPGFGFSATIYDDEYWRDTRSVLAADGTRIAEYRPWMKAELAKDNGDIATVWRRLQDTDLQISEWHGNSVYAFAPTGPGAADYVQISLGRETEWRAGPIVNPARRPWGEEALLDPSWINHDEMSDDNVLAGPLYRLNRAGSSVVHVRTFLARCARLERAKREARRPELERRVWVRSDGTRTPFLDMQPDYFNFVPREVRFFQDWEQSSARSAKVYEHWALDIRDYEYKGEREIAFIPRPLHLPEERLEAGDTSVHILMDRIETIDRTMGLPFAWFFLMTHGNKVSPEVGRTIAEGLRAGRVRLPDDNAKVLLRWVDKPYGF